jgi:hypothetical protein
MNLESLLTRAAGNALSEGSRERALATLALRQYWHTIFDPCPELSRLFGDKNREFMDPFLEHASWERLSMRWTLHGHVLLWMKATQPEALTPSLMQELLAATAARWANFDQTNAKGALLHFSEMGELGVSAWKPKSAEEDSRVVLVRLVHPELPKAGIQIATSDDFKYPGKLDWRPLPR